VTFAPETGSGSVVPSLVATESDGIARAVWTLGAAPGPKVLRVTAATATSPVTVNATAALNRIMLVSGSGQSARINTTLADSIVVKVVDPNGAALPNVSVTFATTSGNVSPTPRSTDAQGLAKVRWTLGTTAGAVTLSASATGADPLDVSARALKADSVFLSAGGSQTGRVGSALPQEVVVEVRDKLSQVVMPGIAVTFTPTAGSGSVNNGTVVTDAAGLARTTWTLGTTKGTKTLNVATVDAGALSLTATALQDTSRSITSTGSGQTAAVTEALLNSLSVRVVDRFGNAVVGDTIVWDDRVYQWGHRGSASLHHRCEWRCEHLSATRGCRGFDTHSGSHLQPTGHGDVPGDRNGRLYRGPRRQLLLLRGHRGGTELLLGLQRQWAAVQAA